jgi:hypothetical protein
VSNSVSNITRVRQPAQRGQRSYASIPEPTEDLEGAVKGIKEALELLLGTTGLRDDQSLTFRDLPVVLQADESRPGEMLRWNGREYVNSRSADLIAQNVDGNGTLAIDRNKGEYVYLRLNGNVTAMKVYNWGNATNGSKLVLMINNTGAFNITAWPAGTIWPYGIVPTITSGANKKDLIMLVSYDAGTTIFGTVVGQDYS